MIKYFIIPAIFYIGFLTSFSDLKGGKILNKHILLGLKIGFLWHIFYILFLFFNSKQGSFSLIINDSLSYVKGVLINFLIASLVGFAMWMFNFWAAGDSKLFSVFSLLLPFDFYAGFFVKYFPSFLLLLNIFICSILIVSFDLSFKLLKNLINTCKKEKIVPFILNFKKSIFLLPSFLLFIDFLRLTLSFLFTFVASSFLSKYFLALFSSILNLKFTFNLESIAIDDTFIFLLFFLLFKPISKLYEHQVVYYSVGFSVIGFILFQLLIFKSFKIITQFFHFSFLSVVLISFRKLYDYYTNELNVSKIPLKEIKKSMILSPRFVEMIKKDKEFFSENFKSFYPDGLTQEQVESIFKWNEKNNLQLEFVEVSSTISFAICIFVGVIVTLIFKDIFLFKFLLL